jgi:hypothetical protein
MLCSVFVAIVDEGFSEEEVSALTVTTAVLFLFLMLNFLGPFKMDFLATLLNLTAQQWQSTQCLKTRSQLTANKLLSR